MALLKYILPIILVTLMTGCFEDFNPDIDTQPVLCINSLITAGKPIEVEISHTWMFSEEVSEYDHKVTDATLTILVNEEIVGCDYIPEEGDKIRIIAESLKYGNATAEVMVPYAAPIELVKVTPRLTDIWGDDGSFFHYEMLADITFNLNIEMDIEDPVDLTNYYRFEYSPDRVADNDEEPSDDNSTYYEQSHFYPGRLEYNAEPIFKEHIGVFETIMGNDEDVDFDFFTDSQFSGKRYTLHLNFSDNMFSVKAQKYDESLLECKINLYLATVSHSYYNWGVYKWNVDSGIMGDLSDVGLAESKWGYSNVSTGAGVVATQSIAKVTIDLKDFLKATLKRI